MNSRFLLDLKMTHTEKYNFWLNQEKLDAKLRKELLDLTKQQIEEAFYKDLDFGTGGLRGIMGAGTNRINLYTIRKATLGFARYIRGAKIEGGVAISYDNRQDSKEFAYQSAMVLAEQGIKSYLFSELRPTPMLSYAVRYFNCAGGIMITASHNPKQYNGYKAYDKTGAQLNLVAAAKVISEIGAIKDPFSINYSDNDLITYIDESFDKIYLNQVREIRVNDLEKTAKIVYSPLHGCGAPIIPKFLAEQGYDIHPYLPQMSIDPTFSKTESSNPEEAIAYEKTIIYAQKIAADIVMVTDPDADRLGIAVKHNKKYHLLTGNQTAAIMLYYLLDEAKKKDLLPTNGFVYTTNVTSQLINTIAESFDCKVITTLTGFKFIGEKAEILKEQGSYLFGCEESYGSLVKDFVRDKDAVQAVFILAEIASFVKLKKLTMIDYLEQIYQKYGYYYEFTQNIMFQGIAGVKKIEAIMDYFRNNPPKIESKLLRSDDVLKGIRIEGEKEMKLDFPTSNVLKYEYEENTWIVFRPSGTEPKIKIYYGTKKQKMVLAKEFIEKINTQILAKINAL